MRVRSWKRQSLLLCRAKLWKRIVGVVHPTKLKQDLRAFWKRMNLRDCVWENHHQIIMKITLQEKDTIHYSITIWFTNVFLCLKLWNSCSKSSGKQGMWKIGENFGVELDKSHKQVTDPKEHFASLMDIWHLKNAESEARHKKKDRVVLRRSQGPKRHLWISKQSSIRSRGAESSHPMDPGVIVQNKTSQETQKSLQLFLSQRNP